jgi:hypothetical protein
LDPVEEAFLKSRRIDQSENAIKGIVGGNAIGQFEETAQPIQFAEAIVGNLRPPDIGPSRGERFLARDGQADTQATSGVVNSLRL